MKKILSLVVAFGAVFYLSSCTDDDEPELIIPGEENVISGDITSNTTWTTGNTYILAGRIFINEGVTLTIEPGVVVKGEAGTGTNATALVVARGGRLMAEGTASAPIIFTSVADEIEPGMIASPNLEADVNGLWGGLLVLGKAPISVSSNASDFQIEGIPQVIPEDYMGAMIRQTIQACCAISPSAMAVPISVKEMRSTA